MYSFILFFFNCVHVTIFTSKMIYSYISKEKASFEFVSTMTPTFMLGGERRGVGYNSRLVTFCSHRHNFNSCSLSLDKKSIVDTGSSVALLFGARKWLYSNNNL